MENEKRPFETWAVVELMGHHQIAGRVTEEPIAGCNMLRVDVPELSAERPAHTKYYGGGAVFAIHPCTEELARGAAARLATGYGSAPLPVAVPELTDALHTIRQAEQLRLSKPALTSGGFDYIDSDDDGGPF